MKASKKERIIKYVNNNPNAAIKQVAKAMGTSYAYTYKIITANKKPSNTLVEPKKIIASHSVSDGSSADYYVLPSNVKELQDLISHKNMNAQIGEIFRACYRYGEVAHSKMLRDAKKIKFYAEAEIKRLEKLNEH